LPDSLKDTVSALFPGIEWNRLRNLAETSYLYDSQTPYGLVQEPNDKMYWCRPPKDVRQMFRRAIASMLGTSEKFDYAEFPHLSNALQTRNSLQSASA